MLENSGTTCVHQVSRASQRIFNELIISLDSSQMITHNIQQHRAAGWDSTYSTDKWLFNRGGSDCRLAKAFDAGAITSVTWWRMLQFNHRMLLLWLLPSWFMYGVKPFYERVHCWLQRNYCRHLLILSRSHSIVAKKHDDNCWYSMRFALKCSWLMIKIQESRT